MRSFLEVKEAKLGKNKFRIGFCKGLKDSKSAIRFGIAHRKMQLINNGKKNGKIFFFQKFVNFRIFGCHINNANNRKLYIIGVKFHTEIDYTIVRIGPKN